MTQANSASDQSTPASGTFATSPSLLIRACDKDAEAWRRIVYLYAPLVEHWCRQASLSPDDTEDVIQDIFLSVAKQLNQFRYDRPSDTFRGWLRVIAQRRVADHFRRITNRPQAEGGTTAFQRLNDARDPLADDADAESEEASVSYRALELIRADFEARTWTAFWRTAIEAATTADVALELGMNASAVRMAKSRVLSRLRKEVEGLISWSNHLPGTPRTSHESADPARPGLP